MRYHFLFILFFYNVTFGQKVVENINPENTSNIAESKLKNALAALTKDSLMRHAAWSFRAINLATGAVLAEKEPDMALIPASNMKIVTTAAALHLLGAKTRLKTAIRTTVIKDKNGCAQGNIAIIGCGDPSLCSQYSENPMTIDSFRQFIFKNIRKQYPKLNKLSAISISNNTIKTETPDTWESSDLTEYYGATASGFNFFDNQFRIQYVAKDSAWQRIDYIQTTPDFAQKWHNTSENSDKIVYIADNYGDKKTENKLKIIWHEDKTWHLEGTVHRSNDTMNLTFAYPFVREHLVHNLADSLHIKASPNYNVYSTSKWKTLFYHESAPISSLVKTCNETSLNLYAEAFLKIIADRATLHGVSQNGIDFVENLVQQYQKKYGISNENQYDLSLDGTHFADACGMSRHNLLTTRFLTNFLAIVQKDSLAAAPFFASLPIAGETGTLKKWFENQPAKGNLRAKTGSMTHVLAYSGYVMNAKNEQIAFSLIVNNFNSSTKIARRKLTTFLNVLIE